MVKEVYDALLAAGAPEDKASAAAAAIANYDNRLAKLESILRLQSWMLTYLVATTTALLWKVFTS